MARNSVSYTEKWELYDGLEQDFLPEEVLRSIQ